MPYIVAHHCVYNEQRYAEILLSVCLNFPSTISAVSEGCKLSNSGCREVHMALIATHTL